MSEPKKVLVVDDEPQITRVLRHSLTAHRYDVRTAADGVSALDTFHDWHPDLIITDLQMPEMDGIEFCREIRKVSTLPIIVLSVRGEERTKVKALDAGADDYITKAVRHRRTSRSCPCRSPPVAGKLTTIPKPIRRDGDFHIDIATREVLVNDKSRFISRQKNSTCWFFFFATATRSSPTEQFSRRYGAAILPSKPNTSASLSASSVKKSKTTRHNRVTFALNHGSATAFSLNPNRVPSQKILTNFL